MYKAHINEKNNTFQTVQEHCKQTAMLCKEFAIPELQEIMYLMGILHDIGKYQETFQKRINGDRIQVEHSICGAFESTLMYNNPIGYMMAYCIAGHHSGIPDGGFSNDTIDMMTLQGRLKREMLDYSVFKKELEITSVDEIAFYEFMKRDCTDNLQFLQKFAFLTRYCFSCLTDADSLDTAMFCEGIQSRTLIADFTKCLLRINEKLSNYNQITQLQKSRSKIQSQVFDKIDQDAEIYLMNMPTGSGKTLCSMKFALERAIRGHKKRIIYVIPFNSIIDQMEESFEEIFYGCAEILKHHSSFTYEDDEDCSEDYRRIAKLAIENWDAQLIVTTSVQFFESIYANKRGKLRKFHNLSESILIFDEAHLMPEKYFKQCLEAIAYMTRYLSSEAVFLTATMPDFKKVLKDHVFSDMKVLDLVEVSEDFVPFIKCKYDYIGVKTYEDLLELSNEAPSKLIIVNKRLTAREIFSLAQGRKFHLSTYMTSIDRKNTIKRIVEELRKLEKDFPTLEEVPEDRKITVVSTTLVEAGVDFDFHTVLKELSGLDSILQAGGRCNREGKRSMGNVYIYDLEKNNGRTQKDVKRNITKGIITEYPDVSSKDCIEEYYKRLFGATKNTLNENSICNYAQSYKSIQFRKYAEDFSIIDSQTFAIVVLQDEIVEGMIEDIKNLKKVNPRMLQKYTCSIYRWEFDDLLKQNAIKEYGPGIWCLCNKDYYDNETGIQFQAKDYFI